MELRYYQKEAANAVMEEWSSNNKTMIVLPTGAGKTIVFSSIISEVVGKFPESRILVLAHRDELVRQAFEKLLKVSGIEAGVEKGQETVVDQKENFRVVVGSVQSMSGKRLDKYPVDFFTHIIIDEAHHAITKSYDTVLAHFPNAKILGVTATPNRADKKSLIKVFDNICYDYDLKTAIQDGYLCPMKAQCIPIQLDITNVSVNAGDFAPGELSSAIEPYLEQIATHMSRICRNRKTVVFTPLIKTSQLFADILNSHGLSAIEVNGKTQNRADVFKAFEEGRYAESL